MDTQPTGVAAADPEAAPDLLLTRTYGAPRDLVWRTWTEPELFATWFGPHGSTMHVVAMDVRPGGILHFRHDMAGSPGVWVRGDYREVDPPGRLVLTLGFGDADGGVAERPGFARETRVTVTLDEHGGGTRMTVRHEGLRVEQGELQGWTESLERLEALLADA